MKGGDNLDKLFGLGLANIFGLFILFVLMIVMLKVVTQKHPIKGVSEVVATI